MFNLVDAMSIEWLVFVYSPNNQHHRIRTSRELHDPITMSMPLHRAHELYIYDGLKKCKY
jgi:hypothetical protein